jgi:hypothetical protein
MRIHVYMLVNVYVDIWKCERDYMYMYIRTIDIYTYFVINT